MSRSKATLSRTERDFYPEISGWLEKFIKSNIHRHGDYLVVSAYANTDFSQNLSNLLKQHRINSELLMTAQLTHELRVDIILVIYNKLNQKGEIIVCEVKKSKTLSLQDCSQLAGYCVASNTRFGLLINIGGGISRAFSLILRQNPSLTSIRHLINEKVHTIQIGFMSWDAILGRGRFLPNGHIKSMYDLCNKIIESTS